MDRRVPRVIGVRHAQYDRATGLHNEEGKATLAQTVGRINEIIADDPPASIEIWWSPTFRTNEVAAQLVSTFSSRVDRIVMANELGCEDIIVANETEFPVSEAKARIAARIEAGETLTAGVYLEEYPPARQVQTRVLNFLMDQVLNPQDREVEPNRLVILVSHEGVIDLLADPGFPCLGYGEMMHFEVEYNSDFGPEWVYVPALTRRH
ncbi:MAG TPA: hypothetical protein VGE59_02915 [Patescibacteria group bacterium]